MIRFACILACVYCIAPGVVQAIEITEVAWMGSATSPNHEWIELYSPTAIDLTDWSLSDGNNVLIELSGTVAKNQHIVLERTSDASAPGQAWQVYTGALVNSGATLTLYDATGAVVDRISGGDNWETIGGDNATKATPQLSSSGWITADPTPGQAASWVTQSSPSDEPAEVADLPPSSPKPTTNKKSTSATTRLTLPDISLQLALSAPATTYVNQPVTFSATPGGVGSTIASSLRYTWNFGDTATATGQTVAHSYTHPGNYVVVVEAAYKRQVQRTRHQITVLPVNVTLVKKASGHFAIQNNSQTEINIAGYRLVGNQPFTIPAHTILLPQSEIVIDKDKLVSTPVDQMVALYDQKHQQVAMHLPPRLATSQAASDAFTGQSSIERSVSFGRVGDASAAYTLATRNQPTTPQLTISPAPAAPTAKRADPAAATQVAAAGSATLPAHWPQYALVGLLLLGVAAIYLIPKPTATDEPWA